ncbi:histone-lysine N-methyltransferase PR-Set7 [Drosophila eugracilis]|uniref:histone-lysine N-methyltransferase PR-Set7 n=1 Tax=Drosophila eugracilis TaxID=29029 RepID=UPI001BDA1051|nr:histone-lysine N-methyltransferase PR-Set7 [Drosophila eugracilis]XP_017076700.2 histone-lysine N-methyltransferase PR-Set7 [Drosophila eugracilis]
MIMVRRRQRPAKETTSSSSGGASLESGIPVDQTLPLNVAGNLLEDQYFASPKRKDCRLMKVSENGQLPEATMMAHKGHHKDNKAGRTIGVPLATRSQTRTIENFFKANAAVKDTQKTIHTEEHLELGDQELKLEDEDLNVQLNIGDEELKLAGEQINGHVPFVDEEDAKAEQKLMDEELQQVVEELLFDGSSRASSNSPCYQHEMEAIQEIPEMSHIKEITEPQEGLGTLGDFQTHRSALRDSHSSTHSSSTDNIFLQEPVLTLDIDRTPTKASSIKINRSFELAGAVFSSPPSVLNACLNGRFNQIVSLNGQKEPLAGPNFDLDHHDSSSCDSGVACGLTVNTESPAGQARRRKPATPHRILCPSPIKTALKATGGICKVGSTDSLSPRKSPRKLPATTAAVAACKSRRRLNQPKPQAPYQPQPQLQKPPPQQQQQQQGDVVVVLDDEDEEEDDDDVHALLKAAEERENQNKAPATTNSNKVGMKAMLKPAPVKSKTKNKGPAKGQPPLPLAATNGNREMTDFFPVRRSVRKTKTAVKEEWMRGLEQAILEERCEGLQVRHFMGKGRGVVAERPFKRNEFVVEYVGDLISITEAAEREKRYALDENAGCYMYYFKHKTQQYCIDATVDTGKLGRLINHSRAGNLMTKVVLIKQRPHLVLLAKDDIEPGEELTYDYGDRSKESLLHHPWLAF